MATHEGGAHLPAKGKLMANLSKVTAEDRARAGITQEMVDEQQRQDNPAKTGVEIVKGPYQEHESSDVITQVRVIDHDRNLVLWSGTEEEFAAYEAALAAAKGR